MKFYDFGLLIIIAMVAVCLVGVVSIKVLGPDNFLEEGVVAIEELEDPALAKEVINANAEAKAAIPANVVPVLPAPVAPPAPVLPAVSK